MTHFDEYNRIIENRKQNPLPEGQYGENHHIVPKSICSLIEKSKENIVRLSAQEHFMAHYHLWLAFRDELKEKKWARKMCFAFSCMKQQMLKCDDVESMSKLYEEARVEFSKSLSELHKSRKRRKWTEAERKKLSDAHKGKKHTDEQRAKISSALKGKKKRPHTKHYTEEQRKAASERMKRRWANKDFRAGVLEKMKRNWQDPDIRNKRIEGIDKTNTDPNKQEIRSKRTKSGWDTRRRNLTTRLSVEDSNTNQKEETQNA